MSPVGNRQRNLGKLLGSPDELGQVETILNFKINYHQVLSNESPCHLIHLAVRLV